MPRRVDIAWGRSGFIVRGFGQTNEQFNATHAGGDSKERLVGGTIFSDAQFAKLARHLQLDTTGRLERTARPELDFIREFTIMAILATEQKPSRKAVHKALALLIRRLASFLEVAERQNSSTIDDLRFAPNPVFGDTTAFQVFLSLPPTLRELATIARSATGSRPDDGESLRAVAQAADDLADVLHFLDGESQRELLESLPWINDYRFRSVDEIANIVRRVLSVAEPALEVSRKRGGPKPVKDLKQAVAWLIELYEACGRQFTHTPYKRGIYDGVPHSNGGQFVLDFLKACDSRITPQQVSHWLADVISLRNERRQQTTRDASF
jgi:hypothetical protein